MSNKIFASRVPTLVLFGIFASSAPASLSTQQQNDFCPRGHHLIIAKAAFDPKHGKLLLQGDADAAVTLSVLAAGSEDVIASVSNSSGGKWTLLLNDLDSTVGPRKVVARSTAGCRTHEDISIR
jgi:hypothetical protein